MKAKRWLVALLAALLVLACVGAVACSGGGEEGTKYTVTYVDITADNATLKTEEVESGGKATEWEPSQGRVHLCGVVCHARYDSRF